jgi:hypothetical protein
MWPKGDKDKAYVLTEGTLTNDETGDAKTGNYKFNLFTKPNSKTKHSRLWRTGQVSGFPRGRLTVWHLLSRALESCGVK